MTPQDQNRFGAVEALGTAANANSVDGRLAAQNNLELELWSAAKDRLSQLLRTQPVVTNRNLVATVEEIKDGESDIGAHLRVTLDNGKFVDMIVKRSEAAAQRISRRQKDALHHGQQFLILMVVNEERSDDQLMQDFKNELVALNTRLSGRGLLAVKSNQ